MKKSILGLCCCLLICLCYSSCGLGCKSETHYFALQNDFIPYEEGSTFQMHDSTGRVIHFVDSMYSQNNNVDDPGCKCCDVSVAPYVRTAFRSDSTNFFLEFSEYAASSNGSTAPDFFSMSINGYTFHGTLENDAIVGNSSTTVVPHATFTLGSQNFSNVYEMSNGLTLPSVGASTVWYHKTSGLLKIAFTDGFTLEI